MIPKTIEEVTPKWLSKILDIEITDMGVIKIGEGIGLLGDIYKVDLSPGDRLPKSVVVKLPSSFEENRQQGIALGMFEAEVRFYNQLGPMVNVGLPKIYHADILEGTADFIIVMEDLSDLRMITQSDGMGAIQTESAVRVLAKIHSVWWGKMESHEFDWIPSMIGPRIEFVTQSLSDMFPRFAENFGEYISSEALHLYELFSKNYLNVNKVLAARSPWTLVHQDCRVENMLFGEIGSDYVAVIDWQGIGRGPSSYDLAYLLGGSVETDLRRQHEDQWISTYHKTLLEEGVLNYSIQELREDYRISHLQGGLATAMFTAGSLNLNNERGLQLVVTMVQRHAQAALDHNGIQLLEELER